MKSEEERFQLFERIFKILTKREFFRRTVEPKKAVVFSMENVMGHSRFGSESLCKTLSGQVSELAQSLNAPEGEQVMLQRNPGGYVVKKADWMRANMTDSESVMLRTTKDGLRIKS